MPVIIDGHNLLWSVQQTNKNFEPINDVRLCRVVGQYLKLVGENGEIIFDGVGPPDKSGFENVNNLEVFFSGRNTDADTVIENKIAANTAPKRLVVVSSDRRLRAAARKRKASTVKSEAFWADIQRQLSKKKIIREPTAKRNGLSESETKQWLKFFGIEQ